MPSGYAGLNAGSTMPNPAENVGVYCLDVGQGDCTFVVRPPDVLEHEATCKNYSGTLVA